MREKNKAQRYCIKIDMKKKKDSERKTEGEREKKRRNRYRKKSQIVKRSREQIAEKRTRNIL